jgi:type IV pilus assembly protein PilC
MDGRSSSGTIEAESQDAAVGRLLDGGLFVHRIRESAGQIYHSEGGTSTFSYGQGCLSAIAGSIIPFVTLGELALVTRELASGVGAGLNLAHAISAVLEGSLSPMMQGALRDISTRIQSGDTFEEALARHPRIFNKMYRGMIKAAEGSGTLDIVLANLAQFLEEEVDLRRRVQGALIYPSIVFVVALGAAFILAWLGYFGMSLFSVMVAAAVAVVAIWLLGKNRHVAAMFRLVLSVTPGIGGMIATAGVARTCLALGTMIKSGVPYLEALDMAKDAANHHGIEQALSVVYSEVSRGEQLSTSLAKSRIFPSVLRHLVAAGEHAGSVDDMLFKVYQYLQGELQYRTRAMLTMIGPLFTILFGALVLYIALMFWSGYFEKIMSAAGS